MNIKILAIPYIITILSILGSCDFVDSSLPVNDKSLLNVNTSLKKPSPTPSPTPSDPTLTQTSAQIPPTPSQKPSLVAPTPEQISVMIVYSKHLRQSAVDYHNMSKDHSRIMEDLKKIPQIEEFEKQREEKLKQASEIQRSMGQALHNVGDKGEELALFADGLEFPSNLGINFQGNSTEESDIEESETIEESGIDY